MAMTRREFMGNSLALGTMSLVSRLDPARRLSGGVSESDVLAFTHVTVIDATGRPALPGQTVLVKGDRIAAIEKFGKLKLPGSAKVIDARGKYVIPGLWDMHVHARGTPAVLSDNEAWLALYLANGITGVREMGGDYVDTVFRWRAETTKGERLGPRILSSGPKVEGPKPRLPGSFAITDSSAARAAVDKLSTMGADFVKIHSDDFPPEGFAALMDEARKQQLTVGGHLPFLSMTMRDAIKSGVKFFEHGTLLVLGGCSRSEKQINDECAARRDSKQPMSNAERMHRYALTFDEGWTNELSSELVKNDVWVTPTLIVLRQLESIGRVDYAHDPQRKYLSSGFWQAWEPTGARPRPFFSDEAVTQIALAQEKAAAMIKLMQSAGVGLLAGSDCSWSNPYTFPGWSLHQELELLVQSGLSPMEVLQTATRNPARFLGELPTNGTVEEGKTANLVLLTANPLEDIRNTQKIDSVVLKGKLLMRGDLDDVLADVATRAAASNAGRPGS
jgi:imidazolonepropionase-like amidohydrolase